MTAPDGSISHVSDTALWVAWYRHVETQRRDAIFRDPYAQRLAGARGEAIVNAMPRGRQMAWAMIVRTKVFDDVIMELVSRGDVDLVVNLAAGLDARPWRLDLPAQLRWVDVDFPAMIAYKSGLMAGETPRCRYETIAADLSDDAARADALARACTGATRALVVAEGLLIYLTEAQVGALATDLERAAVPAFWMIDLASAQLLKWMTRSWGKQVGTGTAQFKFAPEAGTAFFEPFGWREERWISSSDEAARLKRTMRGMWFWTLVARLYPKRIREKFKRFSGYALLRRTG